MKTLYKDPKKAKFKVVERLKGKDMLGWRYQPLFDYFYKEFRDYGFKVLNATYVTADSGVGIVHQAPSFGEEDYRIAQEAGVITERRLPPNPVDDQGALLQKFATLKVNMSRTLTKTSSNTSKEQDA